MGAKTKFEGKRQDQSTRRACHAREGRVSASPWPEPLDCSFSRTDWPNANYATMTPRPPG